MPGRYTITQKEEILHERFNAEVTDRYIPKFNASPTQLLPVITNVNPDGFSFFYWGINPEISKNKAVSVKLYNTPSSQIPEKASFRRTFRNHRCIIPADGFYEWKKISRKGKVPYRITFKTREVFAIAGLWDEYEDDSGQAIHTFSMITVEANDFVSEMSETMPAILRHEDEKTWMDPDSSDEILLGLLRPYDGEAMDAYTVSPAINHQGIDRPDLILPSVPADQFGNYSLFD